MEIFDFQRYKKYSGDTTIPLNLVAIFETNTPIHTKKFEREIAYTILIMANVALGVFCLSTPKACFGSCPTFYTDENANFHYANAEGFSNAISPALEYGDIDALDNNKIEKSNFSLFLKNEALETHCINEVKIMACPRAKNEKIYQSYNDNFYSCENDFIPAKAFLNGSDVSNYVKYKDKQEYNSLSDENDMNAKEEMILQFDNIPSGKDLGCVINFRQTLMTTYLFYNLIGYMGDEASDYLTMIERNEGIKNRFKKGIFKHLGGIELSSWNSKKKCWEKEGMVEEIGPIAINQQLQLLKTKASSGKLKLKLSYTKGLWRIDYVGLTAVKQQVKPYSIPPSNVLKNGDSDTIALQSLQSEGKHLITLPGDKYELKFDLPKQHQDYELFLYSKGYYLEYMRDYWLKDKDLNKVRQAMLHPKAFLKSESKQYKRYEIQIEQDFWNSRINSKLFADHEKN